MAARLTVLKDTGAGATPPAAAAPPAAAPAAPPMPAPAAPIAATPQMPATAASSGAGARGPAPAGRPPGPERATRGVEDLSPALHSMAERLAQDHAKRFRLTLHGLAEVPTTYAATIKDCLIQMLRNAAVHGIEAPEVRRAQAKKDTGSVVVDFRKT